VILKFSKSAKNKHLFPYYYFYFFNLKNEFTCCGTRRKLIVCAGSQNRQELWKVGMNLALHKERLYMYMNLALQRENVQFMKLTLYRERKWKQIGPAYTEIV
jgi:hypothetical protein